MDFSSIQRVNFLCNWWRLGKDPLAVNDEEFVEVLCIRGSELKNWKKEKGETASLRKIKKTSLEKRVLKNGDILLEISGGGPDQPVGRTVIIDEDVLSMNDNYPKVCTNFFRLVRFRENLNKKYINYYLHYFYHSGEVVKYQGGSNNLRNLKFKEYETIKIPLPPLPEQNRIVDKLDKLFGQLEGINERIRSLREIKEKFTYSCLVSSETGQFFSRQKIGKYLEEGKERIGENWAQYRKIGVSAKKGIIDLSTGQKKSFETYKIVQPGDFIYNTMRVNIGSIAIYTGKEIALTSPDYVVFRVKDFLSSELLLSFLKSDQGLLEIGANTKGSVRARLYFKSLSEIRMPVSDQKTQILAEKFLTTYSHSLRKLKKISKTKLGDLEKAVLTKAFKGELVPQLDSDGDAQELLEEIEKLKKTSSEKIKKEK